MSGKASVKEGETLLRVEHLCQYFKSNKAVDDVSFEIKKGEVESPAAERPPRAVPLSSSTISPREIFISRGRGLRPERFPISRISAMPESA